MNNNTLSYSQDYTPLTKPIKGSVWFDEDDQKFKMFNGLFWEDIKPFYDDLDVPPIEALKDCYE